ncbi:MAG: flagellar biosynthesis protein [Lachnospiraceae bacterium]|jgi:flagellar operon protein|nr:flagellar biosynthesis protein [Lachnospiraceae bacterium]
MLQKLNQTVSVQQLRLEHEQHSSIGAKQGTTGFGALLQNALEDSQKIRFSKHAAARVEQRGIEVTDSLLSDLNQAVGKAREKGAKDVVVIGRQGAFIVNVPNNVVVTTMTSQEMKQNIFTNIDSAVLL